MEILGWVTYSLVALVALSWFPTMRHQTKIGEAITVQTMNTALLFVVALSLVPILGINPFHIVWMIAVCFILTPLIPHVLGRHACLLLYIGLDRESILRRREDLRREKMEALMKSENLSSEEARDKLVMSGQW